MSLEQRIHEEVMGGLKNEKGRLKDAYDNRRFADGQFHEYPSRPENNSHSRTDFRRTSRIMGRVIDILTSNLYKASPTRQIAGDPKASEWLERLYRKNAMLPKWQSADRLAHIGDLAAFQFVGHDDPDSPVNIHLWGADQLVWWQDEDDATAVEAVGTLDIRDNMRRLRLWTADELRTYETPKLGVGQTAGGTAYRLISAEPNPYREPDGRGILPFSFVHFNYPTTDFCTAGPGNTLRQINEYLNFAIDDAGDGLRYLVKPKGVAKNMPLGWTPPPDWKPGMFVPFPPQGMDVGGTKYEASLEYVTPPSDWVDRFWTDTNQYTDHGLEMHGVPPGTIRMGASATSGIQLVAEQIPLLTLAEKRRMPFSLYEAAAAAMALKIGRAHLANASMDTAHLDAAASDANLSLRWPDLFVLLPGAERDANDEWRIKAGQADKIQIMQEREGITHEQAIERIKQIVANNKILTDLGVNPSMGGFDSANPSPTSALAGSV
jgi:hypothetical protein